jgi:hypothetical protein
MKMRFAMEGEARNLSSCDGSDEPDSQIEARPGHASLKELNFRTVLTLWQKAARDSAGI